MEAIGRLTGGIAHDFNNLLTAVIGNLELVEARNTDSRAARLLGAARQAAERGARLTAQLLAFSRKQRLRPTAIDINAAAENACELLRSTLGGTITIRLQLEAGLGPAIADATQLDLVILNLAVNARDAMPGGGTIVIATRSVRIDEPPSRPEQPDPGEYVCLSLSDTGSGMTAQVRERAFEPFFTTKDIGQGTGLGLPQVLGVAKQLGGGVDIDSQPGVGTTVRLYLPRAEPRAAAAAPALPEVSTGSLAGLRVLLVDDDEDVRATTAAILADFGCEVLQAAGGEAALALAAAATTDLALIDYAMPGLDGLQTAARLRCQDPQLPVLLMSGYADIGSMQALGDAGVGSVLAKPFPAAVLRERLLALRSAAVPHPCA
jgi:CheY-like chemotaxis protein